MNSVLLVGNLGADPELRFTARGQKVANLRVAIEERFKDARGEWSSTTDWFTVVAWGRLADVAEGLAKGDRVVAAGKLKTRSWDDQGGKRRTVVEVVASTLAIEPSVRGSTSGSGAHGATPPTSQSRSSSPATPPPQAPADGADYFDDDVPF